MSREFEPPMTVRATELREPERNRLRLLFLIGLGVAVPSAMLLGHRLGAIEQKEQYLPPELYPEEEPLPKPSSIVTLGDLHVHTAKSPLHIFLNNSYTKEEVFDQASEKGITIIAFTEEEIDNYDKSQQAADRAGIISIPALEFIAFNRQGWEPLASRIFNRKGMSSVHLLALGVTEPIAAPGEELSIQEAVERIHEQNGLVVIPHPSMAGIDLYSEAGKKLIRELGIDGIEALNAFIPHFMNEAARKLARELGLPVTGGSDTKRLADFGKGLTIFRTDSPIRDWQECLAAIKQGQTSVRGKDGSLAYFLFYLLNH